MRNLLLLLLIGCAESHSVPPARDADTSCSRASDFHAQACSDEAWSFAAGAEESAVDLQPCGSTPPTMPFAFVEFVPTHLPADRCFRITDASASSGLSADEGGHGWPSIFVPLRAGYLEVEILGTDSCSLIHARQRISWPDFPGPELVLSTSEPIHEVSGSSNDPSIIYATDDAIVFGDARIPSDHPRDITHWLWNPTAWLEGATNLRWRSIAGDLGTMTVPEGSHLRSYTSPDNVWGVVVVEPTRARVLIPSADQTSWSEQSSLSLPAGTHDPMTQADELVVRDASEALRVFDLTRSMEEDTSGSIADRVLGGPFLMLVRGATITRAYVTPLDRFGEGVTYRIDAADRVGPLVGVVDLVDGLIVVGRDGVTVGRSTDTYPHVASFVGTSELFGGPLSAVTVVNGSQALAVIDDGRGGSKVFRMAQDSSLGSSSGPCPPWMR